MDLDKYISNLVAHQFPQFYSAEGENFIAFVRAYYEWMEQSGYTIDASKSLLEYADIDTTIEDFLSSFKNEFLINFPGITAADKKFMIKNIKDFYQSKGSIRGMQLLFRLLFDDDIEVYDPGTDILRASDGVWRVPNYIEVENNVRSKTFIGKLISGSRSGATAFVESVHTKVVNQRLIDVITLSSIKGQFLYGELVTDDGDFFNAPIVVGSLSAINVTDGGANNKIGDVFEITASTNGKNGKVRVTAVTDGTGRVTFKLVDGGTGYTNAASQVYVSNTVLFTSNRSNSNGTLNYTIYDRVSQSLTSLNYVVSSPTNPNTAALYHANMTGYDSSNNVVATGFVAAVANTANTIIINTVNGNFNTATSIKSPGNTVSFTGYTLVNVTSFGTVTGSNGTAVGLHSINNTFYGNGAVIVSSANLVANVSSIATGSGAGFEIGSLVDTEVVFLFTDFIGGNNVNQIPYLNMVISGSNSNTGLLVGTQSITCNSATNTVDGVGGTNFTGELIVGSGLYTQSNVFIGTVNAIANSSSLTLTSNALANSVTSPFKYNVGQYGFPKNFSAGYNSFLSDALNSNAFTLGTIASLKAINPGTNYNANPFVLVRNDYIAGFNRKNIILEVTNRSGIFDIGDTMTQSITTPTVTVSYNANTGAFANGQGVTQSNGTANAFATINTVNSTAMVLSSVSGTFRANSAGGAGILSLTSGAIANATAVSNTTTTTLAKGVIINLPNSSIVELKRTSFNTAFGYGTTVTSTSGGTATVLNVFQNEDSGAMGNNAVVTANVSTARGIATQLEILSSGFGHQPGDIIELTSNTNEFAITGIANVFSQGTGEGYWINTRGMLNADKYITDGTYYQDFSYEIQSRLSLDKYANILRQLAHVEGTKMFGRVNINSSTIKPLTPTFSSIGF